LTGKTLLFWRYKPGNSGGDVTQLVEHGVSNRKIAKPWFDYLCGSTSLRPWKRHLMLFPTMESSQPDERHANRTASVLVWYNRHRA